MQKQIKNCRRAEHLLEFVVVGCGVLILGTLGALEQRLIEGDVAILQTAILSILAISGHNLAMLFKRQGKRLKARAKRNNARHSPSVTAVDETVKKERIYIIS